MSFKIKEFSQTLVDIVNNPKKLDIECDAWGPEPEYFLKLNNNAQKPLGKTFEQFQEAIAPEKQFDYLTSVILDKVKEISQDAYFTGLDFIENSLDSFGSQKEKWHQKIQERRL